MGLGLMPFGLAGFLTVCFSSAFVAAAMGAWGVTRQPRPTRRGLHPLVVGTLVVVGYSVVLHAGTLTGLRWFFSRTGSTATLSEAFLFIVIAVAGATAVVARIGLAREILAAAYLGTALSAFALPFVATQSRSLELSVALMASFVPAGIGLLLGALMAWSRRRDREAVWSLTSPAEPTRRRR